MHCRDEQATDGMVVAVWWVYIYKNIYIFIKIYIYIYIYASVVCNVCFHV